MKYSGGSSNDWPLNKFPAPSTGITTFSVQMATSGIPNRFGQHGLQITETIATYISLSSISIFSVSVQRMNIVIISLLTSNTACRIATYMECSVMPTAMQLMPNSISKMWNGSEVITQWLSCSEQPHRSFQKLPEALEQAECKTMWLSDSLRVLWGAPQRSWRIGTEYKNILKSMKSSSVCYKIIPLRW